jgi:hypothetical protein
MAKRTRGSQPARGFGKQPILPDPEMVIFQLMTMLALNMAAEKLSELDTTRTKKEWCDWFMAQADQRLSEVESDEELKELEVIILDEET